MHYTPRKRMIFTEVVTKLTDAQQHAMEILKFYPNWAKHLENKRLSKTPSV
jgi:hypothetical protein